MLPLLTAIRFIHRLLEYNPERRMTLKEALDHEWLAPLRPAPAKREGTATPPLSRSQPLESLQDVSMMDAQQRDDASNDPPSSQSTNCPVPGAYPSSQDPARALQRRRKILDDAKEQGLAPLEPTPEMILNAQRADEESQEPQPSRPLKRKAGDDSSLSPMPEDDEDEGTAQGEAGPSRRGKAPATPARRGPKAGRGRGKAVATADADDTAPRRRSNRLGGQ